MKKYEFLSKMLSISLIMLFALILLWWAWELMYLRNVKKEPVRATPKQLTEFDVGLDRQEIENAITPAPQNEENREDESSN